MGAKVISTSVLSYPSIDSRLVTILEPMGPAAEQFRLLHHRLDRLRASRPLSVVAVTSALAGEGKSTTIANLAACAARRGRKTILVDGDLRRPGSSKLFGFDDVPPGLASILEQEVPVEQAIRAGPEGLSLIPAGRTADDPAHLLGSPRFRQLVETLRNSYEEIYLDLPPVLAFADAHVGAAVADGVVMVVRSGETQAEVVREAMDAFSGLAVLGCVLTGCDEVVRRYRRYYGRA